MTTYKDEIKSGHPQFWRYHQILNRGVCLSVTHNICTSVYMKRYDQLLLDTK